MSYDPNHPYPPPQPGAPVAYPPPGAYPPAAPMPGQPYPYATAPTPGMPVAVPTMNYPPADSIRWREQSHPISVTCPQCNQSVTTHIHHKSGLFTWLIAGGLCFFGFWCGCCLIPFCIDDCKDVEHECPHCHRIVGVKKIIN